MNVSPVIVQREWIDWSHPFAAEAAKRLVETSKRPHVQTSKEDTTGREAAKRLDVSLVDLSGVICVTPGKRGGRIVLETLLRACNVQGLHVLPPRMLTPGSMPEALCGCDAPPQTACGAGDVRAVATAEEVRMAWIAALRGCGGGGAQVLSPLVPKLPEHDDLLAWHALAELIRTLHEDLAGGMISFSEVGERAGRLEMFGETDRWNALAEIHRRYLDVLAKTGLLDPHQARLNALKAHAFPSAVRCIVLVGVVELNALQRAVLQHAGSTGIDIIALIHAPEDMSDCFDEFGCVISEKWIERPIALEDGQIVIADQPDDQAQAVLETLTTLAGTPVDAVTIGLGDEALGEPLERAADWAGVGVHRAEAMQLSRTGPFRLLEVIRDWIGERRFAPFAALLRHPDVERWLHAQHDGDEGVRDWIALLDDYFTDHLHKRLTGEWLGKRAPALKQVHDAVTTLASSLMAEPQTRPLGDWSKAVLEVLERVYGDHDHTVSRDACAAIRDQLAAFASIDAGLQPRCDVATALSLLLASCDRIALPTQPRGNQIDALGWLELHLDAAPNVIVMGVNDGSIPAAMNADPFLPDSLRAALGLPCNAPRYARDAYLMEAIVRSRQRLVLISGRRGSDNEPLTPSRLLMACGPDELPQRVLRLCDKDQAKRYSIPLGAPQPAPATGFTIFPPPEPFDVREMYVTSFKQYLECPYRWWLRSVARLKAIDDERDELDPFGFGRLTHTVLEAFAIDEDIRDCAEAQPIADWLFDRLARVASDQFGSHPPPAVRVQIERLKRRLESFAHYQARTRADGWRIIEGEVKVSGVALDIPGQEPILITGKIDRIDEKREGDTTRYRIIDYKTTEDCKTPFEVHRGKKQCDPEKWLDLQLPLYRLLAAHIGYDGASGGIELGYIVLPRNPERIDFLPATWTDEEHEAAIECARDVVRRIRTGEFPMSDSVKQEYDDFINICQTRVRGRAALIAAGAEEEDAS